MSRHRLQYIGTFSNIKWVCSCGWVETFPRTHGPQLPAETIGRRAHPQGDWEQWHQTAYPQRTTLEPSDP